MTPAPTTLLGLLSSIPDDQTAIIQPEQNIRIKYGNLKRQVQDVADMLAAAGVNRGDRIGIAMPNGLANIVTFLAASMAGTAAPLNPGYKEDEFLFYLEDTNARVLLLPPEGIDDARKAAASRNVPILTVDMDANGTMTLSAGAGRKAASTASPTDTALILHTSGSTGRPKRVPLSHAIAAAVVVRPASDAGPATTEQELLAYCKEKLSDFKRPKQIHIVNAIPRTATGKIQRRVVAEAFAQQAS